MSIDVSIIDDADLSAYGRFVDNHPGGLFYHSLKHRQYLSGILGSARACYLAARRDGHIVAVLPAFIQDLADGRTIINSLPFFGSHGGILMSTGGDDRDAVMMALLDKLMTIAKEEKAISLTLIDNPFMPQNDFYKYYFDMEPSDLRIGQITDLSIMSEDNVADALMQKFHSKTRNMVRKAEKAGFDIEFGADLSAFNTLHEIHVRNMQAINGRAKPHIVFEQIFNVFENEKDYRLYFAKKDGKIAAGLLVLYYKHYCEYYTPVIEPEFRSEQPLSFLIFNAMQDSVARGCHLWNWGGTWLTQDGVHMFKGRWGAQNQPYHYYTRIFDRPYIEAHGQQLIDSGFFYVYPKPKAEERPTT